MLEVQASLNMNHYSYINHSIKKKIFRKILKNSETENLSSPKHNINSETPYFNRLTVTSGRSHGNNQNVYV